MEKVNISTYGTTGLPVFGAHAIDGSKTAKIKELESAFNEFMTTVKGLTAPGNEIALVKFGAQLEGLYWPAYNCVAGKPVVNG
jgi:hypothetical protein